MGTRHSLVARRTIIGLMPILACVACDRLSTVAVDPDPQSLPITETPATPESVEAVGANVAETPVSSVPETPPAPAPVNDPPPDRAPDERCGSRADRRRDPNSLCDPWAGGVVSDPWAE